MSKHNSRKERFLSSVFSVESVKEKFYAHTNFNFQFFDNSQSCGQDFRDWNQEQLYKLFDKLKEYSKMPLHYWKTQKIGSSSVLSIYGNFPSPSDFSHSKHIPVDVKWGRFRIEGDCRLCGFVIDEIQTPHGILKPNTFYVVFLDSHHRFYKNS